MHNYAEGSTVRGEGDLGGGTEGDERGVVGEVRGGVHAEVFLRNRAVVLMHEVELERRRDIWRRGGACQPVCPGPDSSVRGSMAGQ